MNDDSAPIKTMSLMYMVVAIILMWNAMFTLNLITGVYPIDDRTYHISVTMLMAFLMLFLFYMLYQGLITESLVALFVFMSIGSHSFAYVATGMWPPIPFDPVAVIAAVIPIVVIALGKERLWLAIACALMLLGCSLPVDGSDNMHLFARSIVILLSGLIFGIYSGYIMYLTLRGQADFGKVPRALNATATCETIGYVTLGMVFLYGISISNMGDTGDRTLSLMVLFILSAVTMIVSVYSSIDGSISSGTTILALSAFVCTMGFANMNSDSDISPAVCAILALPLVFTACRFHRKKDRVLTAIAIVSIACIALECWRQYANDMSVEMLTNIVMGMDAVLMTYAALSRVIFIETGRKGIPLFDGGSFVNAEEPWNIRNMRPSEGRDSSLALQTYLMVSIGLIVLGSYVFDARFGLTRTDPRLVLLALVIIGALIILFSMENLVKGRLTETIGALSVGVSVVSYSACALIGIEQHGNQSALLAVCMMVCGAIFALQRDYPMSASFACASAATFLIVCIGDDACLAAGCVLMVAAGAALMVRYNRVKLDRRMNPVITDLSGIHGSAKAERTLGVFLLGIVILLLAFGGENDVRSIMIMCILSAISAIVSMHGLMRDDAPGFFFIFAMSLMMFVLCTCSLLMDNVTFDLMMGIFMLMLIPVIAIYVKRGKVISATIVAVLFIALLLRTATSWDAASNILFFLSGTLLCLLALYNWAVHEGLMEPFIDSKLFGFSLRGRRPRMRTILNNDNNRTLC